MRHKRIQLAEQSNTFAICAEKVRDSAVAERNSQRRLETARQRLTRSIGRVCQTLSDDELVCIADYILLITV